MDLKSLYERIPSAVRAHASLVDRIMDAMRSRIAKSAIDLLQLFPQDLEVIDRLVLLQHAHPGVQILWMVGHLQTYAIPLGIHPEENARAASLCKQAAPARFFLLTVAKTGSNFSLVELTGEQRENIFEIAVPYRQDGENTSFSLTRSGRRLGAVTIFKGRGGDLDAIITPAPGTHAKDLAALHLWAGKAIVSEADGNCPRYSIVVTEPEILPAAA